MITNLELIQRGELTRVGVNDMKDSMPFEEWNELRVAINDYETGQILERLTALEELVGKLKTNHLTHVFKDIADIRKIISLMQNERTKRKKNN